MRMVKTLALALALLMLIGETATASSSKPLTRQGFMLDTTISISLYDNKSEDILDGAFELCEEYEQLFSRTIEGSDVYRINSSNGSPVAVSDATAELIETALSYSELSDGAFDPTIEPLVTLWGITSDNPHVPSSEDIKSALALVDWTQVSVDGNTVTLGAGMGIDLGGIAKGYIADKLAEYLSNSGITSALINLGGNVLTIGAKPDGSSFTIGVQKPFGESGEVLGACRVTNMSVVTSGIYERYFIENDTLYHHILDTSTGYPVDNDIYSVTIISPSSTNCDALSTICFALGTELGLELIESLDNTEAIYCMSDGELVFSSGAADYWIYEDEL